MIEIKAELNEILLTGVVGDGWDENPITQRGVVDALRSFGSNAVTVRINSPGGAADEGIGIYNALRSHKGEVTTINDSLAASAASIIFLGGAKRLMADGSRLMIHRAMGFAFGNREELAKVINALESYDASLADIYSQYAKLSKSEIENAMANESWYEVEKAIELGFATGRVENSNKKRKTSNAFDQARVNLLKAKMAQYAGGLTRN